MSTIGQQGQQPQPLEALHLGDEVGDRLGVGQVALERGRAHQQVLAHQPGDQLGLVARPCPSRGHSFIATSAPSTEWSPPRPLAMSCSSTET